MADENDNPPDENPPENENGPMPWQQFDSQGIEINGPRITSHPILMPLAGRTFIGPATGEDGAY